MMVSTGNHCGNKYTSTNSPSFKDVVSSSTWIRQLAFANELRRKDSWASSGTAVFPLQKPLRKWVSPADFLKGFSSVACIICNPIFLLDNFSNAGTTY